SPRGRHRARASPPAVPRSPDPRAAAPASPGAPPPRPPRAAPRSSAPRKAHRAPPRAPWPALPPDRRARRAPRRDAPHRSAPTPPRTAVRRHPMVASSLPRCRAHRPPDVGPRALHVEAGILVLAHQTGGDGDRLVLGQVAGGDLGFQGTGEPAARLEGVG